MHPSLAWSRRLPGNCRGHKAKPPGCHCAALPMLAPTPRLSTLVACQPPEPSPASSAHPLFSAPHFSDELPLLTQQTLRQPAAPLLKHSIIAFKTNQYSLSIIGLYYRKRLAWRPSCHGCSSSMRRIRKQGGQLWRQQISRKSVPARYLRQHTPRLSGFPHRMQRDAFF